MGSPSGVDPHPAEIARAVDAALGREVETALPISPGLDVRRFYRLQLTGDTDPLRLVARVDPNPGAASDLEPIRGLLAQHGLPVPARYGSARGIELLEDLGDQSLERLAAGEPPGQRDALYAEACELVPRLQRIPLPFNRALDAELIMSKALKWLQWTLPLALGRPASASESGAVNAAFGLIARTCEAAPPRLAHRDFKAANLIQRCASGNQPAHLCMIDLQGVFLAPPEYDLVCLLRDSQVQLPEDTVQALLERTRPELPAPPGPDEFARRFDLIAVARIAKDISHYLHAASHRGDRRYLRFVPTGLSNLRAAAIRAQSRDPEISEFAEILAALPATLDVPVDSRARDKA